MLALPSVWLGWALRASAHGRVHLDGSSRGVRPAHEGGRRELRYERFAWVLSTRLSLSALCEESVPSRRDHSGTDGWGATTSTQITTATYP